MRDVRKPCAGRLLLLQWWSAVGLTFANVGWRCGQLGSIFGTTEIAVGTKIKLRQPGNECSDVAFDCIWSALRISHAVTFRVTMRMLASHWFLLAQNTQIHVYQAAQDSKV
jgi:hypothetical protein